MNKSLSKEKFYNVLDQVIPGSRTNDSKTRFYLTRISLDSLDEFHSYSTKDSKFYKYLEYEPFKSIEDSKKYLVRLLNLEGDEPLGRESISWFIRHKKDDKLIGTARLINISYDRQSIMWGYGLDTELWGQGYVFEIQNLLMEYIFEVLCLNRLAGSAMLKNKPTISTLISAGMKEEGIERQSMRDSNGDYCDAWCYSILAEEYFDNKTKEKSKSINPNFQEVDLINIIGEVIEDMDEINDDLEFKSLDSWDSLTQMNLIVSLENAYGIVFTLDEITEMNSVKSIKKILSSRS